MHTTKPKPILRRDGHEKVTGLAKYSAEWAVSGILHAVPIGATIAQGLVTDVQTDIAEKAPGVKLILTVMKPTKVTEVGVFGESVAFTSSSAQSIGPLQIRGYRRGLCLVEVAQPLVPAKQSCMPSINSKQSS